MTASNSSPPGLTALLLIVAAIMVIGAVLAGVLTGRLLELRQQLHAARQACECCDDLPGRRP